MSAPFFVPFNYDAGTVINTNSRTIASGKYAMVVSCSADFAIGGTKMFKVSSQTITNTSGTVNAYWSVLGDDYVDITFTRLNTAGSNGTNGLIYQNQMWDGTDTVYIQNQTGITTTTSYTGFVDTIVTAPGQVGRLNAVITGINNGTNWGWSCTMDIYRRPTAPFWVKAGDALTGSHFTLVEYNSIT